MRFIPQINNYRNVLNQFNKNRKYNIQFGSSRIPQKISDIPLAGVVNTNAAILVFDIAKSKKTLDILGQEEFSDWLGIILHLVFNCIDDYDGFVDKYTGDGVMASFSKSSSEDQCINALGCALKLSEIINKVINPHFKESNFPKVKARIGIDYGNIYIENIGKRSKSQLILVGNAANAAKIFEAKGKKVKFIQDSTIVLGYDVKKCLKEDFLENSETKVKLLKYIDHIEGNSEITSANPYNFYEYTGRYLKE